MTPGQDEQWKLSELPSNLAALTCSHILEAHAEPAFVDYNGGHLTIFCEIGENHEDEDDYRMAALQTLLSDHPGLHDVRLIGGCSRAVRDAAGVWQTSLQSAWEEEN